ncbi:hypothetical protein ASPBRDRAFT_89031, partial [Aspergillus brasiliensis CBS 101740]
SLPHRPKSRPTASCLPCRTRKVKCNRLQPCSTCSARNIPHDCKYAVAEEDRQAIAQAEMIAELRGEVNRLQQKIYDHDYHGQFGDGTMEGEIEIDVNSLEEGESLGDDDELERVYRVLKDGSWE